MRDDCMLNNSMLNNSRLNDSMRNNSLRIGCRRCLHHARRARDGLHGCRGRGGHRGQLAFDERGQRRQVAVVIDAGRADLQAQALVDVLDPFHADDRIQAQIDEGTVVVDIRFVEIQRLRQRTLEEAADVLYGRSGALRRGVR